MRRVLAVVAVGLALVGGCGDELTEAEAARRAQVERIRVAAESGDADRARAEVGQLGALIDGQLADDEIDEGEAARVLAAAKDVYIALGPEPTEATTTTTTTVATTTTTAPPPPDDDGDDDGEDGREGRGKGKGDRDDKDDD